MKETGFVAVGAVLLAVAIGAGAVVAAGVSVALGAACGAMAWRVAVARQRVAGLTHHA